MFCVMSIWYFMLSSCPVLFCTHLLPVQSEPGCLHLLHITLYLYIQSAFTIALCQFTLFCPAKSGLLSWLLTSF